MKKLVYLLVSIVTISLASCSSKKSIVKKYNVDKCPTWARR